MVREPPPWRNDAALLSKIASQEKLRTELLSLSLPCPPSLLVPEHPLAERTTAWFLLQESIRWLQESEGFYVKILQKIMVRYTFLQRNGASFAFVALHSFLFLFSYIVLRFDTLLSSHLLCMSTFEFFNRITMHRECIPLIASRSVPTGGRKLEERKFILIGDSRTRIDEINRHTTERLSRFVNA